MDEDVNVADLPPAAQRVARAAAIAERARAKAGSYTLADTVKCVECLDTGWEAVSPDDHVGTPTLKPCRLCSPVQKRRWRDGHYAGPDPCPCEECALVRRGELKVGRDVDPVTGLVRPGVLRSDED